MSTHYIEEAERLADAVAVMSARQDRGPGHAGGARARTRGRAGARGLRAAAAAWRSWASWPASKRLAEPAQRARRVAIMRAEELDGDAPRGRAPPGQPRGRVRGADRRGDRMSATIAGLRRACAEAPARGACACVGRLEPAALAGVMSRDIVIFSRYWKATTFSSIVQPTIYLLAFGLGFGSLVTHVGTVQLRGVRRDGRRSRRRCCSPRRSRACSTRSSAGSSSAPMTRCWRRRSTSKS